MANCHFQDFLKALKQTKLACSGIHSQHAVGYGHKASLVTSPLEDMQSPILFLDWEEPGGTGRNRVLRLPLKAAPLFIRPHSLKLQSSLFTRNY